MALTSSTKPQTWLPWSTVKQFRSESESTRHRTDEVPDSDLYDLLSVEMNWHKALRHIRQRPIDAQYQDGDTLETPLAAACQNRPPKRVVRAILDANPTAAEIRNRHGDLPIHIACRYNASIDVIRELLQGHPLTASKQSKWGKTPIHLLWESREEVIDGDHNFNSIFWQKMHVLLDAVAQGRKSTASVASDYILHAAVSMGSLGCPHEVLEYALYRFPQQVKIRDSNGDLPLHLAIGPTTWTETTASSRSSRRKYKPRELKTIVRLLDLYPDAARVRLDSGRLPLHEAIANGHEWHGGVRELFQAAPEALALKDPLMRVYPFQLAAAGEESVSVDLDSIYCLLRCSPGVLEADADNFMGGEIGEPVSRHPSDADYRCFGTGMLVMAAGVAALLLGGNNTSSNRPLPDP